MHFQQVILFLLSLLYGLLASAHPSTTANPVTSWGLPGGASYSTAQAACYAYGVSLYGAAVMQSDPFNYDPRPDPSVILRPPGYLEPHRWLCQIYNSADQVRNTIYPAEHGHAVATCTAGTRINDLMYIGNLPTGNKLCRNSCEWNVVGSSLGFGQGTANPKWFGDIESTATACTGATPDGAVSASVVIDATKTCVTQNGHEVCTSNNVASANCGTVDGRTICVDNLPAAKCTDVGGNVHACDKGTTAPVGLLPYSPPGAPIPELIGNMRLPPGSGGVAGSGGLAGPDIGLYGSPSGLLPGIAPTSTGSAGGVASTGGSGTSGTGGTGVSFPADYARDGSLVAIGSLLGGVGTDPSVINNVAINGSDATYNDFNSSISALLGNPVGNAFAFSFGLPVSGACVPLNWNVHAMTGTWDYCTSWDTYGRPTLAFLFYALTAFFIYDVFSKSAKGK